MARFEAVFEQFNKRLGDLAATTVAGFAKVDAWLDDADRKTDGLQWRMTSLIFVTWVTTMIAILFRH